MPHCQAQLGPAATIESLRQMFKRKIVNTHNNGTWRKRGRRKLDMQNVNRMFTKLGCERERNSNQGRMRKCSPDLKIRPSLMETLAGLGGSDVEGVLVYGIDLRKRLDEIGGVAFITRKLRPN